jgi:hypothetical protein
MWLKIGKDGELIARCRAGCRFDEIVTALGLTRRAFYPGNSSLPDRGRFVRAYVYTNEKGSPLFRVVRWEPKAFTQERWEDGRYIPGTQGIRKPLYGLMKIMSWPSDSEIILVEGEKDVETLWGQGLCATTSPGGCGKWLPEHADTIARFRRLMLIPDNDDGGRKHMQEVAAGYMMAAAPGSAVTILSLPDGIKDVSKLISGGGRLGDVPRTIWRNYV